MKTTGESREVKVATPQGARRVDEREPRNCNLRDATEHAAEETPPINASTSQVLVVNQCGESLYRDVALPFKEWRIAVSAQVPKGPPTPFPDPASARRTHHSSVRQENSHSHSLRHCQRPGEHTGRHLRFPREGDEDELGPTLQLPGPTPGSASENMPSVTEGGLTLPLASCRSAKTDDCQRRR